ncbi:MAG: hypothetical protein JXB39_06000 [Deltaproteobacteria bacterium]|nr:hypothetical protein [Deltaproteobacteria bacterium]
MAAEPLTLAVRASLGPAAVLSLRDAARLLPGREADARRWLRDAGVVRVFLGAEVVTWGDVIRALPPAPVDGELPELPRPRAPLPMRRHPLPGPHRAGGAS